MTNRIHATKRIPMGSRSVEPSRRQPSNHRRHSIQSLGNLSIQASRTNPLSHNISSPRDLDEQQAKQTASRIINRSTPLQRIVGNNTMNQGRSDHISKPLPKQVKQYFEPRFAQNLDHIQFRNDICAHSQADSINARAYTSGHTISFAEGQFNPHSEEGRQLIAHELAHATQPHQTRDDNTIYRETWDVDDSNKTVERGVLVQLIFENTWTDWANDTGWTDARKNTFRSNFESSIENTFNNNNTVLKPPASAADVLPADVIEQGYKPRVDISLVPDGEISTEEDWEVDVSSNPSGAYRKSSNKTYLPYGTLNEASNNPFTKRSSAPGVTQIPTVHEFGHFIGLEHPGEGLEGGLISDSRLSPGANEYGHTGQDQHGRAVDGPNDLMGGGMGLRNFYFNDWAEAVDEHIEALRTQRTLEELQRNIDEFFRGHRDMGDFPIPTGDTRFG